MPPYFIQAFYSVTQLLKFSKNVDIFIASILEMAQKQSRVPFCNSAAWAYSSHVNVLMFSALKPNVAALVANVIKGTEAQSETAQMTMIVHTVGRACNKSGSLNKLALSANLPEARV